MHNTGMYFFIFLVCIMWVAVINIIKVCLQRDAKLNDSYAYFIELTLIDYHESMIIGITHNEHISRIKDRNHEWKSFVQENIGRRVRLHYNVTYSGIFFIYIHSDIEGITIID